MSASTLPPVAAIGLSLRLDDLSDPRIAALLEEHLADMRRVSPPESVHALDLERLKRPEVRFWTAWDASGELLGCGALKRLSGDHAELKSMRTATAARGRGVARAVLNRLLADARDQGVCRLSLETGPQDFFAPAHALYRSAGFEACGPFEGYVEDPYSLFMTRTL
ncbi:GNAT family N-acetyltransferase [Mitsuaria sp. WAJ17]|uniref:GNAT family N-acetyltransferase n=1 Tax=Mitsuaria sp. WAJ17 TaxID=2761452 RepID=UPI0016048EBD|nr:GNAT family N-acetyltransferase [Mitsuaria sp. WAJ17]MBB2484716.1 GNAT family N-acetyltransferase [Mitsuaria sp. WAJ17]